MCASPAWIGPSGCPSGHLSIARSSPTSIGASVVNTFVNATAPNEAQRDLARQHDRGVDAQRDLLIRVHTQRDRAAVSDWGSRGREFKSRQPDQQNLPQPN